MGYLSGGNPVESIFYIFACLCLPFHFGTMRTSTAFTNYSDVLLKVMFIRGYFTYFNSKIVQVQEQMNVLYKSSKQYILLN